MGPDPLFDKVKLLLLKKDSGSPINKIPELEKRADIQIELPLSSPLEPDSYHSALP